MKNLNLIQKIFKVLKVIISILFVLGVIGIVLCLLFYVLFEKISYGELMRGQTVNDWLLENTGMDFHSCKGIFLVLVFPLVAYTSRMYLLKRYLKMELTNGTPFNKHSANQLIIYSFITIIVSVVCQVLTQVLAPLLLTGADPMLIGNFNIDINLSELIAPLLYAFAGLIFSYGADLEAKLIEYEN